MLPVELSCQQQVDRATLQLRIDSDLFWFQGHFPGLPILPGVAQLDWVIHYATSLLAPGKGFAAIESIKFQHPVPPSSLLQLELYWLAEKNQLTFSYQLQGGRVASSGKIILC